MTNENSTLVHEGVTYRKVNRKANLGEKVLHNGEVREVTYASGDVITLDGRIHKFNVVRDVLEPIAEEETESQPLTLTEADVRNNPRQVIDLIANLAGRVSAVEQELTQYQALGLREHLRKGNTEISNRIDRLASANEQAINLVARNVETWAQETERIKHELAKVNERTQPYQQAHELFVKIAGGLHGRDLTDEERREL